MGGGSDEEREFLDLMQADMPLPEDEADLHETQQRVRQVVQSLPDHLREILVLAYFQQFPYKQIAQMLDIPLGTVKSRLHTAVGTFADQWARQTGPTQDTPGDAS
jgi:RNA polymerase sigma-70 factor (ECF subfamily)